MDVKYGYDVNFVEDISDHLTCVICQLVLRNPVCFVDCGHRLCKSCYTDMRENAIQSDLDVLCPYDRIEVDVNKVFEDTGLARLINDMKVKCNYSESGCDWVGELGNLESHLQRCMVKEKRSTAELLQNVQYRLSICEERIHKNEKELHDLRSENQKKDTVIDDMRGEITSLEENVEQLNDLVNYLSAGAAEGCETSLDSSVGANLEELATICNLSQVSSTRSTVGAKLEELATICDLSQVLSTEEELVNETNTQPACQVSTRTSHTNETQHSEERIDNISKQLEKLTYNMKTLEQLTANKKVVFKWKVENYNFCKEVGDVFSPVFYSCVNGHCCVLGLEWFGNKKGKLGLNFSVCRDHEGETVKKPFRYAVELEISGKDYDKEYEIFPFEFCKKSRQIYGTSWA